MRQQWILAPIALSVFVFFILSRLRRFSSIVSFVKNSNVAVSDDPLAGKALQLNTPLGDIDMQTRQTHDPNLESIPKYPGGVALDLSSEFEMQLHFAGRDGRYVEQGFWTTDPLSVVVAYYQREFSSWKEDSSFSASASGRFRCYEQYPGFIRSIEIRHDAAAMRAARKFSEARAVIKYSVLYGDQLTTLPNLR